jgi:hypothetical protein
MDAAKKLGESVTPKSAGRVGHYATATTKKVSISLDCEALEWAQEVARREGRSVSSVVSDAVNETRRHRLLGELLDEMGTDDIPPEVEAEVDAELRAAGVIK